MELPPNIVKFIELAGGNICNYQNPLFFTDMVTNSFRNKRTLEQDMEVVEYVRSNIELLTVHIKGHPIFDYFFDKAINLSGKQCFGAIVMEMVLHLRRNIINNEESAPESADILSDRTYIYRLQSNIFNHFELFKFMVAAGFDLGDESFLINSIISRGEVEKLKILEPFINLAGTAETQFPFVFATALKFGRHEVIRYLRQLKLDPSAVRFGRVLDLEHYEDNPKYVFYRSFAAVLPNLETPIVGSKQNYNDAFHAILECLPAGTPTLSTLDIWAENARLRIYSWDKLYFKEVFDILNPHLTKRIPLSHDFGEFNSDVFGREWSDRHCLIEHCLQLESRLSELEGRNSFLHQRLRIEMGEMKIDFELDNEI